MDAVGTGGVKLHCNESSATPFCGSMERPFGVITGVCTIFILKVALSSCIFKESAVKKKGTQVVQKLVLNRVSLP